METAIPHPLIDPDEKPTFLAWLHTLEIPTYDKLQILRFWADRVGTKVTPDMLTTAGIERR